MSLQRSPTRAPVHDLGTERNIDRSHERTPNAESGPWLAHRLDTRAEHFAAEFRYVRLPLFWRNRPKLWFVQLESEFSAYRMRSDDQKYNAVLRHLDETTSDIIADVLEKPPDFDKYEFLKRILIACLTDSEEKQLRTLLLGLELGDKKPSQLLQEMKSFAGSRVSDDLLRTLWCQRLPARTQELLFIFDNSSLDKLAECADKIHEHLTTLEVHATEARMSLAERADDPIQQLTMQVAQLAAQVRRLERPHSERRRDRSRGRSRSRGRHRRLSSSASASEDAANLCY